MIFYLTGLLPILYLLLTVAIAVWVGFQVERRMGPRKPNAKWWASGGAALILLLLPTWNILLGRAYMYYRCTQDGGLHVYRHVVIPERYFDANGNPKSEWIRGAENATGSLHCFGRLCFRESYNSDQVLLIRPGSAVERTSTTFRDAATGRVLGRSVRYYHRTWYAPEAAAASCPSFAHDLNLTGEVFVKQIAKQGG